MTYKMTDEYQKILTEMIGEIINCDYQDPCTLPKCNELCKYRIKEEARTFTTPDDKDVVFRWLVDNGKWEKFAPWATNKYWAEDNDNGFTFLPWLFYDAERFCCLAAMAKKEGVLK